MKRWNGTDMKSKELKGVTDMEDEKNPDVIPQGKKAEKVSSAVSSSAHGNIYNYTKHRDLLIILFSSTSLQSLHSTMMLTASGTIRVSTHT